MSLRSKTAFINIKTYVQNTCIICRILHFSTVTSLITPCLIYLANKAEENKLREDSLLFSLKHCYLLQPIREESWDWQITLQERSQGHTSGDANRKQTWNITLLRIPALGMVLGQISTHWKEGFQWKSKKRSYIQSCQRNSTDVPKEIFLQLESHNSFLI